MFTIKPSPVDKKVQYIYKSSGPGDMPPFPFAYINVDGIIFFMIDRVPMTVNELKELVVDIQMNTMKGIGWVKGAKRAGEIVGGEQEDD